MLNNDYQNCDFYQSQAKNANSEGFASFFDAETAKYYFAFVDSKTEKVIFRSEGYPTVAAQKTGLASVIKNMTEEKQFSIDQVEKQFFVVLKAKNKVEIARSCPFNIKAEAEKQINTFFVKTAEVETIVTPSENKATKVTTTKKVVEAAKTVAVKVVKAVKEVAKPAAKVAAIENNEFAPTELYLGYETIEDQYGKTGFALFQAEAKHYFAVYNNDGSLFQGSKGFAKQEDRDATFHNLKNALVNKSAYKVVQYGERFKVVLLDNNENILSSSAEYNTFTEAFMKTPQGWTVPTEMVGNIY